MSLPKLSKYFIFIISIFHFINEGSPSTRVVLQGALKKNQIVQKNQISFGNWAESPGGGGTLAYSEFVPKMTLKFSKWLALLIHFDLKILLKRKHVSSGNLLIFFRTPPLKSQKNYIQGHKITRKITYSKHQKSQITEKLLKNHMKKSLKITEKNHVISKSQKSCTLF